MKENKLILEFLGADLNLLSNNDIMSTQYHKSWDWLMPVVEKIEYCDDFIDGVITIEYKDCIIPHRQGEVRIEGANSKLEAVYQAVVEFIKQYNKENESND